MAVAADGNFQLRRFAKAKGHIEEEWCPGTFQINKYWKANDDIVQYKQKVITLFICIMIGI